jgi:hypothetical protein
MIVIEFKLNNGSELRTLSTERLVRQMWLQRAIAARQIQQGSL